MFVLATLSAYDPLTHGPDGPSGCFIVDCVWSSDEFMRDSHKRRAARHRLRFEIVKLTHTGLYSTCVLQTYKLRLLQRAIKRRLAR